MRVYIYIRLFGFSIKQVTLPSRAPGSYLPAADHLLLADLEPERLVSVVGRIKRASVRQGACGENQPLPP